MITSRVGVLFGRGACLPGHQLGSFGERPAAYPQGWIFHPDLRQEPTMPVRRQAEHLDHTSYHERLVRRRVSISPSFERWAPWAAWHVHTFLLLGIGNSITLSLHYPMHLLTQSIGSNELGGPLDAS